MTVRDGYELDMSSPVSHVATEMEGAGSSGPTLTVQSMATSYQHPVRGDLARIRHHEAVADDDGALLWLLQRAVEELGGQVARDGDGYRLAREFAELRWNGRRVPRAGRDDHARLGDPFNPMTGGAFADNIRVGKGHKRKPPEDAALRESMSQVGWLPGHPAVMDERGVVITGHRRLKIATELDIPVREGEELIRHTFGSGDSGDIQRLTMAWWSNEGTKGYTPEDRKAMAVYLRERGWTQASIAEALHVVQGTISKDLQDQEVIIPRNNYQDHDGKRRNKPGAGRPRTPRKVDDPLLNQDAEQRVTRGERNAAALARDHGVGRDTANRALDKAEARLAERVRLESQQSGTATAGSDTSDAIVQIPALLRQLQSLVQMWSGRTTPDPASELDELRRLRLVIDQRITALAG